MAKSKALEKILKEIKKYKVTKTLKTRNIIESIVLQAMVEVTTEAKAQALLKKMEETYYNWNEIRITRPFHIIEEIEEDANALPGVKAALNTLQKIFNVFGDLSESIFEGKPDGEIRKSLEKILPKDRDAAALVMMESMQKIIMPISVPVFQLFKDYKYAEDKTTKRQLQKDLTQVIGEKDLYGFYQGVERLAQDVYKKSDAKAKKATKKKVS